jgi:hypothetical protein
MEVNGLVVRDIQGEGGVSGLSIAFEPAESERADLERFVEGVQSTEHTRRLGEIAEFGVQNLLQMFTSTMPTGTLALQHGQREGEDLSKVEAAVLDLVRAGFTVQRMVDVIPEPDPAIYRALFSLSECGAISF